MLSNGDRLDLPTTQEAGTAVGVAVRPERIRIGQPGTAPAGRHRLDGKMARATYVGNAVVYAVNVDWIELEVRASTTHRHDRHEVGDHVMVTFARSMRRWWRTTSPTIDPPAQVDPRPASPRLEIGGRRAASRRGFLLGLPALLYLTVFFMVPLGIVVAYSFGTRSRTGRTELRDWNLDAYARLGDDVVRTIAVRSLWIALATTLISLVLAYPLAYYMSTRTPRFATSSSSG